MEQSVSFVWTVAWGKILTNNNLHMRGFFFVFWCCMCRCNGEMMDHLLLHCDVAYVLWSGVFKIF